MEELPAPVIFLLGLLSGAGLVGLAAGWYLSRLSDRR